MAILVLIEGGAPLDAPADPSTPDYPARPEWFFLCLFQMLKHFPGRLEWVGSIVIPSSILLIFFLLPLLDRILPSKFLHFLACCFLFAPAGRRGLPDLRGGQGRPATTSSSRRPGARPTRPASAPCSWPQAPTAGIPPEGAGFLMRHDPLTHGQAVLEKKCLGCHVLGGKGSGEQTASDLKNFGSRAWIRGLLENPKASAYYGKVPGLDGMVEWKKNTKLKGKQLDDVADFVASFASIPADITPDEWLNDPKVAKHPGNELFQKDCGGCHKIEGYTEGGTRDAPGLFAWGSPQWISRMIRRPTAPDLYGYYEAKDHMPPFGPDQMTDNDVDMVIRYLEERLPHAGDAGINKYHFKRLRKDWENDPNRLREFNRFLDFRARPASP